MAMQPHILAAAGWFYMSVMLPLARYGHSKPRLAAQHGRLDHVLASSRRCLEITRCTHDELMELADRLGIDPDEQPTKNWRFSHMHRLVIALYCLSAAQCLRRAKQQWGWAINSISSNVEVMCDLIIDRLDAPGSRTCAAHHARLPALPSVLQLTSSVCLSVCAAYAITGWSMEEQDAWIAAPTGPAAFHDCIGFVDATYIRVERPAVYALERRLYSTYKKYHAVFFLAIVDRSGQ